MVKNERFCNIYTNFVNRINRQIMKKEELIDKLGNTLIYFSKNMSSLSKTKALKLIYLLDEYSIEKYGIPFFNLEYEAWKFGPVNQEIFTQLDSQDSLAYLKNYIYITKGGNNSSFIKTNCEFSDDEFSDNDINLLEYITKAFKTSSAEELVNLTHKKDGLWYNLVKKHNLLDDFEKGIRNTSDLKINFHKLVENDNFKLGLLREYEEIHNTDKICF